MTKITAQAYIHGGDYDCSELIRMCFRAVDILPYGSYMWTGNEIALLKQYGFVERSLSNPKRGDVLWRDGHTEMYLGNGIQGGARISETGGINGTKGDQTGKEITSSIYRSSDWTKLLRYEGIIETYGGIPVPEAAAQVMEHVINHSAHGYSQPNRAGDGTIEEITLVWDSDLKDDFVFIKLNTPLEFAFNQTVKIRTSPNTKDDSNLRNVKWNSGETVVFDAIAFGSGYMWGSYIGASTGLRLYSAIGPCSYGTPLV